MPSHGSKRHHFHQHHDAGSLTSRTRALHDTANRNLRIPGFPGKLSRQRMPDIITSNSIRTSVKKSFGKGYACTEGRTDADHGDIDSDELVYADCHYSHDR